MSARACPTCGSIERAVRLPLLQRDGDPPERCGNDGWHGSKLQPWTTPRLRGAQER